MAQVVYSHPFQTWCLHACMRVCVCVYRCVFIMYYGCVWGWSMAVAFVVYVCLLWDCLKWVWVSL